MMRVLVGLCILCSAFAFAPLATVEKGTTTKTSLTAIPIEKEIGAIPPLGFWDPLDLINKGPYGSPEKNFYHYRTVEVKHGRAAMLATLGTLVQENYHYQGYLSPSKGLQFSDVPNGLKALEVVPLAGWVQIIAVLGAHEFFIKQVPGKKPGNLGTGYWGAYMDDESAAQLRALTIEISNGRLAMLGILGMWASEVVHKGVPLAETKIFS